MKRSPALDAIRGIAIVLVLIWHYLPRIHLTPEFLITSTRMFWSGVDLFFVLSGFLIAGVLLQNVDSKNYFSTFYIRRAARIIPLYTLIFFVFVAVLYLAPKLGADYLAKSTSGHLPLWSYLTFTQNFVYAITHKFDDPWMDVTWSLAVEEQFYIALSLLVRNLNRKKLLILALTLIVVAPILRLYASNDLIAVLLPLQRADTLMLGVLLALTWQSEKGKQFLHKHASLFRWSCFLLLLVLGYATYSSTWHGGDWLGSLLALFYCNLILLALIQSSRVGKFNLFNSKILEWFGLRSYGLYLFHKPIQVLIPFVLGWILHTDSLSIWVVIAIYTVVLFVVSEASYRFLEKPIMAWGHRFKYERPSGALLPSKALDPAVTTENS